VVVGVQTTEPRGEVAAPLRRLRDGQPSPPMGETTILSRFDGQLRDPEFHHRVHRGHKGRKERVRIRPRTLRSFRSVSVVSVVKIRGGRAGDDAEARGVAGLRYTGKDADVV
jgi:hypothetical protein